MQFSDLDLNEVELADATCVIDELKDVLSMHPPQDHERIACFVAVTILAGTLKNSESIDETLGDIADMVAQAIVAFQGLE